MDYNKITIRINPFEEWLRDVLTAQLGEIGYDSFLETETGIEAYIPAPRYHEDNLFEVIKSFEEDFTFEVGSEIIKSQNWNEVWEKNYFKPLVINNECVIRAPFHTDFPKAKYEIIIEPNMAFGTGNHETTTMMIETILENDMENMKILDMGCGTGILGILASMKGAKNVTAIDIDEWSYTGAKENARLNHIENMEVKLGDASLLGEEKFDIIFANIHKNVLLNDIKAYSDVLQFEGLLIVSGFYREDIPEIKTKAESLGLKDSGFKSKNNWVAHAFKK
jgi:ribosomal protein L11 methyltransferase